jgi:hypothetical protein
MTKDESDGLVKIFGVSVAISVGFWIVLMIALYLRKVL